MAEMFIGRPLFQGKDSADQLLEIIKILGTPTINQITQLNDQYKDCKLLQAKAVPWSSVIPARAGPDAIDLLSRILKYTPAERIGVWHALEHPYFDELRNANTRLPNGKPLPELFNFTESGE